MMMERVAFATGKTTEAAAQQTLQQSIYVTGTKKLIKDALIGGQAILAALVALMFVVWEIMKRGSDDNESPKFTKMQKGSLIGLIVGETIGVLIGVLGGYYGFKVE